MSSQSSRTRSRERRASSRSVTSASRSRVRGSGLSGSASARRPRRRLPPEHSGDARRVPRHREPGAIWATCPPEFGVRSVLHRLGQLEPKVLFAVAGYRYGDEADRPPRAGGRDPRGPAERRDRRPRPVRGRADDALPDAVLLGRAPRARASRSSSSRCRSHIRCTSSSRRGRPACRRRSCTATAASSSST